MVKPHDFLRKNTHNSAFCCLFLCFYIAQVHCFCRNNGINFNVPTFYLPQVRYILNKQIAPVGSWECFTNSILSRPFGLFGRLDFQGLIETCVADDPGHLSSIGVVELHVQSLITWSVIRRRLQCLYGNPKYFKSMDDIVRELKRGNYVSKYWHIFYIIYLHHSSPNPSGHVL